MTGVTNCNILDVVSLLDNQENWLFWLENVIIWIYWGRSAKENISRDDDIAVVLDCCSWSMFAVDWIYYLVNSVHCFCSETFTVEQDRLASLSLKGCFKYLDITDLILITERMSAYLETFQLPLFPPSFINQTLCLSHLPFLWWLPLVFKTMYNNCISFVVVNAMQETLQK